MSQLHSGDELSLRHLPDVSDASFSFQIPGFSTAENLLADDDDFFRGGANVSMETLASPRKVKDALTLDQLTPRPPVKGPSSTIFPSSLTPKHQDLTVLQGLKLTKSPHISKPRPSAMNPVLDPSVTVHKLPETSEQQITQRETQSRRPDPSELVSPHEDIAPVAGPSTEVMMGTREPNQQQKREERRQKMATRTRTGITRTVKELPEAKSRADNTKSSTAGSSTFPTSQPSENYLQPDGDGFSIPDTSVQSVEAKDSVTERLVKFGQRFINPFSNFPSDNPSVRSQPAIRDAQHVCEPPIVGTGVIQRDVQLEAETETTGNADDGPLTVSQLSPRKCASPAPAPTPPVNLQVSALRSSSSKRPVSETSENHQGREKRVKTNPKSAAQTASSSTQSLEQRPRTRSITRQVPKAGLSRSDTASHTRVATRLVRTTRSASANIRPIPTQASSTQSDNSGAKRATSSRAGHAASTSNSRAQSSLRNKSSIASNERKRTRLLSSESKPAWVDANGSQPPTNATQHADSSESNSRSQSDLPSRSLSRSSHSRSQRRYENVHPVPDFKALHAAHEASLANRKENIQPTKPIEIQWETDIRAKERRRFDEMIKEKEREQELLKEQQRKEREEQEEREIRELRKKAIPKANEVPEWYKDVPRKKDKGASLDSSGASSIRR